MLSGLLITLNILVCVALIGVVLMQRSEGGALGSGGNPGGLITARGAGDLLTRTTWILFGLFLVLSLGLTLLGAHNKVNSSLAAKLKQETADVSALNQKPATNAVAGQPDQGPAGAPAAALAPPVTAPAPVAAPPAATAPAAVLPAKPAKGQAAHAAPGKPAAQVPAAAAPATSTAPPPAPVLIAPPPQPVPQPSAAAPAAKPEPKSDPNAPVSTGTP